MTLVYKKSFFDSPTSAICVNVYFQLRSWLCEWDYWWRRGWTSRFPLVSLLFSSYLMISDDILSNLILSHLINLISSHLFNLISYHLIWYLISFLLIWWYLILSYLISPISSHLFNIISSLQSHQSHLINLSSSLRSYLVSSHLFILFSTPCFFLCSNHF